MYAVLMWNSPRSCGSVRLITGGTMVSPSPSARNAPLIASTASAAFIAARISASSKIGSIGAPLRAGRRGEVLLVPRDRSVDAVDDVFGFADAVPFARVAHHD